MPGDQLRRSMPASTSPGATDLNGMASLRPAIAASAVVRSPAAFAAGSPAGIGVGTLAHADRRGRPRSTPECARAAGLARESSCRRRLDEAHPALRRAQRPATPPRDDLDAAMRSRRCWWSTPRAFSRAGDVIPFATSPRGARPRAFGFARGRHRGADRHGACRPLRHQRLAIDSGGSPHRPLEASLGALSALLGAGSTSRWRWSRSGWS